MKWETLTSTIGHSAYALWNNGKKLLTLVFNPASNAARIEFADEKRVFLIRKEGLLKNKTVLCNEYGIRIGHTGSENNKNYIVLNNERLFYKIENREEPALTIYKDSKDRPLAICEWNMPEEIRNNRALRDHARYSLLMTLCWYLFQPAGKENQLQYSFS